MQHGMGRSGPKSQRDLFVRSQWTGESPDAPMGMTMPTELFFILRISLASGVTSPEVERIVQRRYAAVAEGGAIWI